MVGLEVPGDGLGAGVKTTGNELLAQVRDQFDGVVRHACRRVVGPASSGFERGVAFGAVSGQQARDE